MRCIAIKGDGEQCTRAATTKVAIKESKDTGDSEDSLETKDSNKSKDLFCSQHSKIVQSKKVDTIKSVEPWTLLKYPTPDPRNGKKYIQKIRTHLNNSSNFRAPKSNPHSGFIYVFYLKREKGLHYYKIGYTERPVEERLEEWSDKHDLELYASYHVTCNVHKFESLIHLYLAYCRMYRYPNDRGGFHSVFKLSGKIIRDGQENEKEDERLVAKNKEIEWFCAPIAEILEIIEGILKIKKTK